MTLSRTMRAAAPGLILAAIVLIGAVLALATAPNAQASASHNAPSAQPRPCAPNIEEDDPRWDWTCMGNGFRGVVTMWGTYRVVSAHRFCRLYWNGNLSYPRSEHMRGDQWAIRNAC